jgi:hypothetical protein
MRYQGSIGAVVVVAALSLTLSAQAADYPDWSGQWVRVGNPNWVQAGGPKAPLTPEYQKVFEANRADLAAGGIGGVLSTFCIPQGMPMMMNIYDPMELIITPKITYLLISHVNDSYRRIYTDGRDFPADPELNYAGYSIGSTPSATVITTSSTSRPAPSRGRASTTPPDSRCMLTIRACSTSASSSTRTIPISSMTRSRCTTTR